MNPVEAVLLENIDNPAALFIFPTDVAASRWVDHLLRLRGGTVAMRQFIAWDTFKQNSVRSKVQNKRSIPSALRTIFVSRLIRENAELCGQGKPPVFSSLIRVEWADQAASFTGWITSLLPQLAVWFKKTTGLDKALITEKDAAALAEGFDADDRDLFALALRYAQFLESSGLFEPAWETPPFEDTGKECFIFFPESLSDFSEYRELLAASGHVKTISLADSAALISEKPQDVFFYTNSRSEITEAALYIRALHERSGVPWDSISVSIADTECYEPYVLREFDNRNIPWVRRTGKPLSSYPAGRFFSALAGCASADFSFTTVTALLLNKHLPWKDSAAIQKLVDFGIKNNCISSWTEDEIGGGRRINVWEDAFEHPFGGLDPAVRRFFNDLKWRVTALRNAASFAEVRKHYFVFREHFFDMEQCLPETDLVLSRCVSELMYLAEIEKSFPGIRAPDPFQFFSEYLGEVNYLAQQSETGVVILPYRTAAPAPFDCHVVLGAGQEKLSAVFSRLEFLPQAKREKLGLADEDASAVFINLHRLNSQKNAAFFCSEHTFSGYAIPHSRLGAEKNPRSRYADDPAFSEKFSEDLFAAEGKALADGFADNKTLPLLHENQIEGFTNWLSRRYLPPNPKGEASRRQSAAGAPVKFDSTLLELIQDYFCRSPKFPGKYSVSASSLAPYYRCSLQWLFERVLSLENVRIEADLMAENIVGQVYHAALHLFFSELQKSDDVLAQPVYEENLRNPALPGAYRNLLAHSVDTVFADFPRLGQGEKAAMSALTARLLEAEKVHFYFRLEKCLAVLLSYFAGCRIAGSEAQYQSERDTYFLNGTVDCLLEDTRNDSPSKGSLIIIDFKLNYMPPRSEFTGEGEGGLINFQLPLYLSMAEEQESREVHTALFFSIIKAEPEVLFGVIGNAVKTIPNREDKKILRHSGRFAELAGEFAEKAERFADEIKSGAFSVLNRSFDTCVSCNYYRVCRTIYKIDGEKF
jgi:hypothetical protein